MQAASYSAHVGAQGAVCAVFLACRVQSSLHLNIKAGLNVVDSTCERSLVGFY